MKTPLQGGVFLFPHHCLHWPRLMTPPFRALLCLLGLLPGLCAAATPYAGPLVDAWGAVDLRQGDLSTVPRLLEQGGVGSLLLDIAGPGKNDQRNLFDEISHMPSAAGPRIVPLLRAMNPGFKDNNPAFYLRQLEGQARQRSVGGVGMLPVHAPSLVYETELVDVAFDDPRLLHYLDMAADLGVPAMLLINFRALDKEARPARLRQFSQLLDARRGQMFTLLHLGFLSPELAGRLLDRHDNLHLLTSNTSPDLDQANQPWSIAFTGYDGVLKPAWRELLLRHASRFVTAIGAIGGLDWNDRSYPARVRWWREVLGQLPLDTAQAIAHLNAGRLWPSLR
jgi:hypothetical protein